ncbi:MAG: hypothetical protein A2Z25_23945 [Planctomycetes bacterium RBG_16_55_9]|nr:MAG: hypothetical protein A2Z25_23945 [Planctomycetes bacterium RBG_16_55_9]
MNTFWLKIAGLAVLAVGVIVLVTVFTSGTNSEPEKPQKTFYDQAEEDRQRFSSEPQAVGTQEQEAVAQPQQTPAQTQSVESVPPVPEPAEPPKPTILYFKPLSEIETIEAERLLSVAVPGRSIGRLPMTGSNLMVPNCRQIISKWPDSWYAYRAKQMLADLPERDQKRYSVTKEELDMSRFAKPRPGSQPFKVEESR